MKHGCESISALVSEGLERGLSFRERVELRFHLLFCSACRHYNVNMQLLRSIFHERLKRNGSQNMPEDTRNRIKHAIQQSLADDEH